MSILGSIISKIFHASNQITTTVPQPQAQPAATAAQPAAAPSSVPSPQAMPATVPLQEVDVHAVLMELAARQGEKLNWQQSIVDLLKVVGLDSSLEARKELAKELNYSGDTSDSASMNIWLHKQVIEKLAENGGKLPENLKAA